MANLNQAVTEFKNILSNNLTGIGKVYDRIPDSINDFPGLIIYPNTGNATVASSNFGRTEHTIILEILHKLQEYDQAIEASEIWESRILQVMVDFPDLNGTIEHFVYPVEYRFGQILFNTDQLYWGVQFRITFKQNRNLSNV